MVSSCVALFGRAWPSGFGGVFPSETVEWGEWAALIWINDSRLYYWAETPLGPKRLDTADNLRMPGGSVQRRAQLLSLLTGGVDDAEAKEKIDQNEVDVELEFLGFQNGLQDAGKRPKRKACNFAVDRAGDEIFRQHEIEAMQKIAAQTFGRSMGKATVPTASAFAASSAGMPASSAASLINASRGLKPEGMPPATRWSSLSGSRNLWGARRATQSRHSPLCWTRQLQCTPSAKTPKRGSAPRSSRQSTGPPGRSRTSNDSLRHRNRPAAAS